ncbi:MAG: alanine--tRNA ligase [Candidatus Pacebacteria bacterium]|nr:alanine--tRNA ligase [Candidatus Paceibacterota bacterium]
MDSREIRSRFLKFFEKRGHAVIPSASLVPQNDPSVLFNTAGMQPLVPYLLGEVHPMGKRIVNVQKCVRTQDIEEVGDNTHDTFFEMMGNWSLGDYFKEDAIKWSFEFLTSKEEGLGLDKNRLYITVFEGDENAPKDTEAFEIWKQYVPEHRIYFMGAKSNWWSVGENGPCGPDTEMFYDVTEKGLGDLTKEEYLAADERQEVVEIWNDVFMQYVKKDGKIVGKLPSQNVDTGSGLERIVMAVQGKNNIFDTDLFNGEKTKEERIVADHVRTALFMISDGVIPSNVGRGYVLRRLIRRAVRFAKTPLSDFIERYKKIYKGVYVLDDNGEIAKEEAKFRETLERGLKEFEKGIDPFVLATTYGFPIELTQELAKEKGQTIDLEDFNKKMAEHQKLSQTASAGMFKGGLANHNEKTIRLHTAHHLLLAALQEVVGKEVKQRGSNITEERLRIDFLCDHKLTDEEKQKVEAWVNEKIEAGLDVVRREMPLAEAQAIGAEMEFGAKYPEIVSVYFIEDKASVPVSKEFCGGPHVKNTSELSKFKIQKEEAVSQGVRRIKAVLL